MFSFIEHVLDASSVSGLILNAVGTKVNKLSMVLAFMGLTV